MPPMSEANGPDKSLLRWQEGGELYEAEERVLKAFREDWKTGEGLVVEDGRMIFAVPPEGSSAPEKPAEEHIADDWQGAILRAEFLRDLFLGNYGKFDPRLIEISRAWIEGRLDLDYCESRLPLAFARCIFSDGISLWNAIIPEVQLPGCEVRSSLFAQDAKVSSNVYLLGGFKSAGAVDLNGADIGGQLACSGGHFEEGLKAQNLKTGSSVFLRDGFKSAGAVDLNGADIGGQLDCSGGHFEEGLTAQSLKTGRDVFLSDGFKSAGAVVLLGADIGGHLACSGGHFEEGLTAQNLKTGADVFLGDGFKANGEVSLSGADIGGRLSCSGGHFEEGLTAPNLKTGSSVFLRDGFKSAGVVDLNGADIGGQLACRGGHFEEGLTAPNLKTGKDVFLSDGFKSAGAVDLNGADIGGQLSCSGGHFEGGLTAQSLKTGSSVFLSDGFKSAGAVDLHGADIGGQLDCSGGHFEEGLKAQNLKTGQSVFLSDGFKSAGAVVLNGADIGGQLDCSGGHFEGGIILNDAEVRRVLRLSDLRERPLIGFADGFRYQAIEFTGDGLNWEKGLDWVKAMTKLSNFSPQPYEQLMSVYRRMGHTNWARNIGFALEERRSKEFKGWRSLAWRAWYGVLRWTIGYGYRPFGFVAWALGLMAAGFLLFSNGHDGVVCGKSGVVPKYASLLEAPLCRANEWIPSDGEALASESWMRNRKPPPDYLPLDPFVYSLEATFPVLSLGQLEKWHPSNGLLLRVRWVWSLVGTLLLAILALFGAGVLGPRWRSGDEGE